MVVLKFSLWIRSFVSETNGTGSNSRLVASLCAALAMALVWVVTLTGRDIPPSAQVVLLALLGASTVGYGVNKFTTPKDETA